MFPDSDYEESGGDAVTFAAGVTAPDVGELDESSPIAEQPASLRNVQLKRHQLTLLHRCHAYETGRIRLDPSTRMYTSMGIIGDKVGSGKSFVVLALILSGAVPSFKPACSSHALDTVHLTRLGSPYQTVRDVKTSLLVVPHNLCMQWSECVREHVAEGAASCFFVSRMSHYVSLLDTDIGTLDLIVVTSTFYNDVADLLNSLRLRVRRVVYDEVDSMKITCSRDVFRRFAWLVTASYANVIGSAYRMIRLNSTGFIKELACDIQESLAPRECASLVIRNRDAFVDSCFQLPEISCHVVRCKTPYVIDILHGNIDAALLERLNADDVSGAMQCIDPNNLQTQSNIVDLLVRAYTHDLDKVRTKAEKIDRRLLAWKTDSHKTKQEQPPPRRSSHHHASCSSEQNSTESCTSFSSDERGDSKEDRRPSYKSNAAKLLEELRGEADKLGCRIASIRERIVDSAACGICYGDLDNKTITSCCSHAYCFKCINTWLSGQQKTCPICKSHLDVSGLLVVRDGCLPSSSDEHAAAAQQRDVDAHDDGGPFGTRRLLSKLLNFENIVTDLNRQGRKVLVFSNYDTSLDKIHAVLRDVDVKHATLKGHIGRLRHVLDRYKQGDLNVLLVNASAYGSGLNLQNTTDIVMFHKFNDEIERQVLGRAQRNGRVESLNVWYLLHENEVE